MTSFQQLVDIVKKLRGPSGCPWDKEQTHKSLTPFAIEEALELEQAIENEDMENTKEELGDLLFQSVLHSEIARQNGDFNIDDVIEHLNHKMITRHPHVFANATATDSEEVINNWEAIKDREKANRTLFDTPKSFPALLTAQKIGKRTKRMDFDWKGPAPVFEKVEEELEELREAMDRGDAQAMSEEMGDLLFSVTQLARHLEIDAEKALRQANSKFINRFEAMIEKDPEFHNRTREAKETLWQKVKKDENKP